MDKKYLILTPGETHVLCITYGPDHNPDPMIVALFGTHIIPTPYVNSEINFAFRETIKRNPDCKVRIIE